ncbi:enoyl-CoA hydratase/isomerase family protein [Kribbia dieselivorans]|uniref:enoyl-CoA hydratase/isomerase family protein n=1 Tax=Kribbia dieselivorans TaxID=331526 RepID=UPI0008396EA1|nr:enoyl-CoA hydratase-related protein [Kribbia dieselivorans]
MSDQPQPEVTEDVVLFEVEDGIATIRLNRPQALNALNTEVQEAIRTYAREATERKDVAAVIVYGGERAFAAGADIKMMAAMSYTEMVDAAGEFIDCIDSLARIPKPTVAAITGFALGGGLETALACDFRVLADNGKLGFPEVTLGVIPGMGGTQRLPRLIGVSKAKDLIYSGRTVKADEALAIGLVDRVVPAEEVYATAKEWMKSFVGGPAYAIRAAKEAVDRGMNTDLTTGLQIEQMLFSGVFATRDRENGMNSFIENGPGKATFEGA